jgi:O-methyltransferase
MPPSPTEPWWEKLECIKVSELEVRSNFDRFELNHNVNFIPGNFSGSLSPVGQLAVLRLDCDMYSSTLDALTALWPKLSDGGFLIVDDYQIVPECRKAVEDYFNQTLPAMFQIDGSAVWCQKDK